ncbi:MAG: aspartate 1-decarboxylase [Candidatus Omnitrophica bacterium]|nr:aspartate 1-decarboxylase [Candidatus Omnitrophota bacterium]
MLREMYKSKIHRATVTEANLQYQGSITLDKKLMDAADLLPNEKVQVVNLHNGTRIETYCFEGKPGTGVVCMNGAAARWAQVGDEIIIIAYALMDTAEAKKHKPRVLFVDRNNRLRKVKQSG